MKLQFVSTLEQIDYCVLLLSSCVAGDHFYHSLMITVIVLYFLWNGTERIVILTVSHIVEWLGVCLFLVQC